MIQHDSVRQRTFKFNFLIVISLVGLAWLLLAGAHVLAAGPCCLVAELAAASDYKPAGTTTTKKKTTTLDDPKIDVTASEGSTATAMRGKPAPPAPAGAPVVAVNPDVIALQNTADLIAKDLGFTALAEITFKLVNRGSIGINTGSKTTAAQPPGPPISIEVWIGSNKVTVQQQSIAGKQTKIVTVPMPSNYTVPKCLEARNLKVVIDPQNQIAELYDNNNVVEAPNSARPCPDLAVKSIERHYTGTLNETYQPKVTVINLGNAPSPATQVWGTSLPSGVWPVTGWPELVPKHTIPALQPGEATSFRTGGSVLSINHTAVRVILDRFFEIEESDESNNFKDKQL